MKPLDMDLVREFVNEHVVKFHTAKIRSLEQLNLQKLLKKKNPYLFRAKNIMVATDLVKEILDAFLSASEERLFGDFLEDLAVFVASQTCDGRKSAATGLDLEFMNNDMHYLVSVKSGPNWGNSSQQNKQEADFKNAVKVLKQSNRTLNVQPVLGICYGSTRTTFLRGYMKVVGQNFWYLISENENLYTDIIEPIGHKAQEHNEAFSSEKSRLVNIFSLELMDTFCDNGYIKWDELVAFNSGNLDLV